ncbi:signal peptidase I SipW [Pseudalkalibacillus decolorationis]|uniref:signal peptidase I SipW n=1 Tax=Pseudalkalibacillus decolorationis TaxID=163879 RepID=UPI002147FA46|nr:signal peptidase I [Pseudalkalibacillus decolorationis]
MKKVLKWVSNITSWVLIAVFVVMIFMVVSSKASGGEPNFYGYQLKSVLSGSMEPTFDTGSIIAVDPTIDKQKLKKGDIITFKENAETLITHRIIEVKNSGNHVQYITKGDNNDGADLEPVLAENVVAKYEGFTIPFVGYFMNFANSKIGTAILLVIPGILLIIYSVFTIWKSIKEIDIPKKEETSSSN